MTTLLYKTGDKHEDFGIKCEIIRVNNPKEIADWIATGKVFFHPADCYKESNAELPDVEDPKPSTEIFDSGVVAEPKKRGRKKAS